MRVDPHEPLPGRVPRGPYGVRVYYDAEPKLRRTLRGAVRDRRGYAVQVTAASGVAAASMQLETLTDLQAIDLARLFATSPRMLAALLVVERAIRTSDHPALEEARAVVAEAINYATERPLSCL